MKTKYKLIEVQVSPLNKYHLDPKWVFPIMYMIFCVTLNM